MPFRGGTGSGGGGGSGTVTSISVSGNTGVSTAISTSGTFALVGAGGISTSASGLTLTIDGSGADTLVTKSANYTILTTDKFILADHSGTAADLTFTLPASPSSGMSWHVVDTGYGGGGTPGTYKTIIDANGANINQGATYNMIGASAAISIVSDGTNYFVF